MLSVTDQRRNDRIKKLLETRNMTIKCAECNEPIFTSEHLVSIHGLEVRHEKCSAEGEAIYIYGFLTEQCIEREMRGEPNPYVKL